MDARPFVNLRDFQDDPDVRGEDTAEGGNWTWPLESGSWWTTDTFLKGGVVCSLYSLTLQGLCLFPFRMPRD